MSRNYYSDYADHCLKFYFVVAEPVFHNEIDRLDWAAVHSVMTETSDTDKELLEKIFTSKEKRFISDRIKDISADIGLSENGIFSIVNRIRKQVAIARGIYFDRLR